ncbi:hypothetical protein FSP39_020854 [Pinctada imbricata]|uniref:C2H2-type domain-containing protein n=1 Tax=Pinctada imbricata TaxID=66713 RepID=A0AA89C779_PINIB|nr:hypothetical protein FSP39_020854 [Pinctada imbricata]
MVSPRTHHLRFLLRTLVFDLPIGLDNLQSVSVMDAVNLVALISTEHKTAAWKFWEEAGQTVRFFTLGMVQGAASSEISEAPNEGISTSMKKQKLVKRKMSDSPKSKRPKKKPKSKTPQSKAGKKVGSRKKRKTNDSDSGAEDANEIFESLFRESQQAVQSITEPQEEMELSHLIQTSNRSNKSQGEQCVEVMPQIILNADDIVNQVHACATDVQDVTQALRNVSAEVEVHVDIVSTEGKKKRKRTSKSTSGNIQPKCSKSSFSSSTGGKTMKKKIGLAKKYLRVKRIQTEPTEEYPVLKKRKKKRREPKPEPTKEEKLKVKYERKLRHIKKKKIDKNYIYESHNYSAVETNANDDNGMADDNNADNEDYSFSKFLEEEEQKENKKHEVRYNADGSTRKRKRLKNEEPADLSCTICGIKLSSIGALDAHMRIHTGERPFKCQFENCDKSFTTRGNLKRHEQYHKGERPFKCDVCDKTFTESKTLKVHQRVHTGDRPFKGRKIELILRFHYRCDLCDMAFTQSNALQSHKAAKHSKQKEHLCELCGEGFILKSMLRTHMKKHSEDKQFMCDSCNLGFDTKEEMARHQSKCNRYKFTCLECDKKFTSEKRLTDHQKQHIDVKDQNDHLKFGDLDSVRKNQAMEKSRNQVKVIPRTSKRIQSKKSREDPRKEDGKITLTEENIPESEVELKAPQDSNSELPDHIIMTGDTLSSDVIQQIQKSEENLKRDEENIAITVENIPESKELEVLHDSNSELPDHIIMTGDNLSSNEIQQIQAVIHREAEKFRNLDEGEVQIILSSDHASFFDDPSNNVNQDDTFMIESGTEMAGEEEVLIVNTSDDQQVLTIYSQNTSKS